MYVEHRSRALQEIDGKARGLLERIGIKHSDRETFTPVGNALARTARAESPLLRGHRSPWIVAVFLPPFLVSLGGNQRATALLYALIGTVGVLLLWPAMTYRVLAARFTAASGVGACCLFWLQYARSQSHWHASAPFPAMGKAALFVFYLVEIPVLVFLLIRSRRRADREGHPYDTLVPRIVNLADRLYRERARWNSSRSARDWQAALEVLAVDAARILSLASRTDRADTTLRRQMRAEGARIAEGIRALKQDLARAGGESDVVRVVENLTRGMVQVARHDRAALLAAAPAEAPAASLPARVLARLVPAATFFGAAVCVRWVPLIAHSAHLVQAVQWSLVVSGVAMLVSANTEVRSRIQDIVGKALSA